MITRRPSMYRSKRTGKNRVTGVPLTADGEVGEPVFDHGAAVPSALTPPRALTQRPGRDRRHRRAAARGGRPVPQAERRLGVASAAMAEPPVRRPPAAGAPPSGTQPTASRPGRSVPRTACPSSTRRRRPVPIYQTVTFSSADAEELGAVTTGQVPGLRLRSPRQPDRRTPRRRPSPSSRAPRRALPSPPGWPRSTRRSGRSSRPATGSSPAARRTARRAPSWRASSTRLGVRTEFVDVTDLAAVEAALAAGPTRILYAETISNPTIVVADHVALAELAHRFGATYVVDNTFASPYLCRPVELGADLVCESATKYLSGHCDVMAGIVVGSERPRRPGPRVPGRHRRQPRPARGVPGDARPLDARPPDGAPLEHGGLARGLARGPAGRDPRLAPVARQPSAARRRRPPARRAAAGCWRSSSPAAGAAGEAFIDTLTIPERTASLGSVFTIVIHPPSTTHRQLDDAALAAAGITPGLLRCSVGLEDLDDLVADFECRAGRRARGGGHGRRRPRGSHRNRRAADAVCRADTRLTRRNPRSPAP